ncbi:uncharacterized protein Stacl isoform X2 [Lepeophtheirus salmonis]|uniref:uncharacterized protein Stacl isoform X2 n=1 Tax=Lepeophtheirus salmonis TaxID=72036 RepID=UPI001AE8D4D9|nr:uncharacterized protein LOC121119342 isoform X2 [Lepeophtheirus salmonis]
MTSEITRDTNRLLIRDLIDPTLTEPLKNQQQTTFKLIKTMSDFTHDLSKIHEQHSDDLQNLVEDYRRRNSDFRGDRVTSSNNSLLSLWDSFLQEIEMDSQIHSDIAGIFLRVISRPLLEKTFHMKIQSRKVFNHRESFESVLGKTEEMLIKCHEDYSKSFEYQQEETSPSNNLKLIESHNNYIQQLHASNGMIDQYYKETLPQLLQELDDVYQDVSAVVEEAFAQGTDVISLKSVDTSRRYEGLTLLSKNIKPSADLNAFVKTLNIPDSMTITKHLYFSPPQVTVDHPQPIPLIFRDEIHVDRVSQSSIRNRFENLRKESFELDSQTRQLNDALETLVRIQARSLENQLYNKVNELQEDISLKRFDLRIANLHLAAIQSQKELFATKCETSMSGLGTPPSSASGSTAAVNSADLLLRERKLSSSSGGTTGGASGGMKNKWVKAFKSIKGSSGKDQPTERQRTGNTSAQALLETNHIFQEYTYKKITPCDVCSQILRGHTRQGMKCKLCRLNVHPDCQEKAAKCQPKTRLLRRQKSASELDPRIGNLVDEDIVRKIENRRSPPEIPRYDTDPNKYDSRSSAQEIVISRAPTLDYGGNNTPYRPSFSRYHPGASNTLTISGSIKSHIPKSAPHSPQGNQQQKKRLNFRNKSISLDSPESCQIAQASFNGIQARERRRTAGYSVLGYNQRLTAPIQYRRPQIFDYHPPSSPVQSRRPGQLRTTTTTRMSSVELPDEAEKSVSSASTSPCPSPKPNRFTLANVFVVLYNFKPRHADELDLKLLFVYLKKTTNEMEQSLSEILIIYKVIVQVNIYKKFECFVNISDPGPMFLLLN